MCVHAWRMVVCSKLTHNNSHTRARTHAQLLHRLNDAYNNTASSLEENGMWIDDFVKALAMMGKSLDITDQKARCATCHVTPDNTT